MVFWGRDCRAVSPAVSSPVANVFASIYLHSFDLATAKCRQPTSRCARRYWQPHTIPTLTPR